MIFFFKLFGKNLRDLFVLIVGFVNINFLIKFFLSVVIVWVIVKYVLLVLVGFILNIKGYFISVLLYVFWLNVLGIMDLFWLDINIFFCDL